MDKTSKIFVAGGQSGLVGSAIVRALRTQGFTCVIVKTRKQLDLLQANKVEAFFKEERPEYVFLAAALVGGIMANKTRKADFIYDNLLIQNNVIHSSWQYGVKKLLFLGSSCIYPKLAPQPIKESYFMTGPLEETNDAYAVAKIAGIKMCQSYNEQYKTNFISIMPTNLYGPNDNFDLQSSHVLPALIHKFHDAKFGNKKEVVLWGSGNVYREFLYVDDMADACIFLMKNYNSSEIINVGTGKDLKIKELALLVSRIINYSGKIVWDTSKPDGTPKKQLDVSKLFKLGWKSQTSLINGIKKEYEWFLNNFSEKKQ